MAGTMKKGEDDILTLGTFVRNVPEYWRKGELNLVRFIGLIVAHLVAIYGLVFVAPHVSWNMLALTTAFMYARYVERCAHGTAFAA